MGADSLGGSLRAVVGISRFPFLPRSAAAVEWTSSAGPPRAARDCLDRSNHLLFRSRYSALFDADVFMTRQIPCILLLGFAIVAGSIGDKAIPQTVTVVGQYRVVAADFHVHSSFGSDGTL